MESYFDNQLRKKFEDIAPEDTGVFFDKERVWDKINGRSPKRVLLFKPWLTHIAATIAGIIVAGYFFSRQDTQSVIPDDQAFKNTLVKSEKADSKPAPVKNIPAPAEVVTTHTAKEHKGSSIRAKEQSLKAMTTTDTALVYKQLPVTEMQESVVAIVLQKTKTSKVLHIADMNNENGIHHYVDPKPGSQHFRIASMRETKEPDNEMLSALISNYVTNKKFK